MTAGAGAGVRLAAIAVCAVAGVAFGCRPGPAPAEAPGVVFSTYLGGSREDSVRDVAVDAEGNVFATGGTASPDFPATPGAAQPTFAGDHDVWVAKASPDGRLLWATFLGGPRYDRAYALELDRDGDVVVAGRAGDGFPTTAGALQTRFAGDSTRNERYGAQDGFVAKLSGDGARVLWATYVGAPDDGFVRDVALDSEDRPVVAMSHRATTPWATPGAYRTEIRGGLDGFLARLSADGSRVEWGTYVGGSGDESGEPSVRVTPDGVYAAWSTGSADAPTTPGAFQERLGGQADVLYVKLSPDGARLLAATYLGGSGKDELETHNLAIDRDGSAIVAGGTTSSDFPTTGGAFQGAFGGSDVTFAGDAFVSRISADGTTLLASTYLGGEGGDAAEGVWIAPNGDVGVSGVAGSRPFAGADAALRGPSDAFVARLSPDLRTLRVAMRLGGSGPDMGRASALHPSGDVILGAITYSDDLPLRAAVQSRHRSFRSGDPGGREGAIARLRLALPGYPRG